MSTLIDWQATVIVREHKSNYAYASGQLLATGRAAGSPTGKRCRGRHNNYQVDYLIGAGLPRCAPPKPDPDQA